MLGNLTKKNQAQESAYDVTIEDLFNATVKLEEKEKICNNAEGEVRTWNYHPLSATSVQGWICYPKDFPLGE